MFTLTQTPSTCSSIRRARTSATSFSRYAKVSPHRHRVWVRAPYCCWTRCRCWSAYCRHSCAPWRCSCSRRSEYAGHIPYIQLISLSLPLHREQYDLRHTIQVMVDLGLNFVQLKSAEGHYVFQPEPDLDTLCSFPGKIAWRNPSLNLAINESSLQVQLVSLCLTSVASSLHVRSISSAYVAQRPRAAKLMERRCSRKTQLLQQRSHDRQRSSRVCRIICKHWSQNKLPNTMETVHPSSRYTTMVTLRVHLSHPSSPFYPNLHALHLLSSNFVANFSCYFGFASQHPTFLDSALSWANPVRANNP